MTKEKRIELAKQIVAFKGDKDDPKLKEMQKTYDDEINRMITNNEKF